MVRFRKQNEIYQLNYLFSMLYYNNNLHVTFRAYKCESLGYKCLASTSHCTNIQITKMYTIIYGADIY
jgi:hypothetical protein